MNLEDIGWKWALVFVVVFGCKYPTLGATYYVNPGDSIQTAIDGASYGDTVEVSVGTYDGNITLKNGVALIGAGASSTIINGSGSGSVVYSDECDPNTLLEDFTITKGDSDYGGGMYNEGGGPTITDCVFSSNIAANCGGGMYNNQSDPTLTRCTFNSNSVEGYNTCGGGIYGYRSNPTLTDCEFTGNSASYTGGGMHNEDGSPELTGCTFNGNEAESGGGMYNDSWHDPVAGNCTMLTDCTFTSNSSLVAGGGMYNIYCDSILTSCTFEGNSTVGGIYGGGGMCNDRSLAKLKNCTFDGNSATSGSGGGFLNMLLSESRILDCLFTSNSAYYDGSGMYNRGSATVINCTFTGNSGNLYTHSSGGGISNRGLSSTIINCIFKGNSAGFGGGMNNRDADSVNVVNCTFSANSAGIDGAAIYNRDCHPVITNSIIWGNIGQQIYNYYDTAEPNVTYSCIQGSYPGTGNIDGNPVFADSNLSIISPSPCIDAGGNDALPPDILDLDGDSDMAEPTPLDLLGNSRRANDPAVEPDTGNAGSLGPPIVDMGAYEISPVFVDDDAPLGGDGAYWPTAYKYLQDALNNEAGEIRVAQGIYKPDQDEGGNVTPGDREATFRMQNVLTILGGYRGLLGGGDPDDRDIATFETILSGDCAGNDDPNNPDSKNENSLHVITSGYVDATSEVIDTTGVLEGFTITAGNANEAIPDDWGAGMFNIWSSPTVTRCTFRDNTAADGGGMMNFFLSNPIISNCSFIKNLADDSGGGIFNDISDPKLENCTFRGNKANNTGGGMYNSYCDSTFTHCTFTNNTAFLDGAMSNWDSTVMVIDCVFNGNSSEHAGAGGISNAQSTVTVTNCTFSGNSGSGMYGWNSDLTVTNSTFSGNVPGGISVVLESSLTITNCIFWDNELFQAGDPDDATITYCFIQDARGLYCSDPNDYNICAHPLLSDPLFLRDPYDGGDGWIDDPNTHEDEAANNDYGDLRLTASSPCIDVGNNDADTDADTPEIEPLPETDLDGRDRFTDGDCNDTEIVDMGAYEFTYAYIGDFDADCDVELLDFVILADYWLTDELLVDIAPTPAGDGIVDVDDLAVFVTHWLEDMR